MASLTACQTTDPHTCSRLTRATVQLSAPSPFVESAAFLTPAGEPVVQTLDLSLYLNSLMFSCAATPGLSKVLLELLDFEKVAMRARDVIELRGGANGEVGGRIGLTFARVSRACRARVARVSRARACRACVSRACVARLSTPTPTPTHQHTNTPTHQHTNTPTQPRCRTTTHAHRWAGWSG